MENKKAYQIKNIITRDITQDPIYKFLLCFNNEDLRMDN